MEALWLYGNTVLWVTCHPHHSLAQGEGGSRVDKSQVRRRAGVRGSHQPSPSSTSRPLLRLLLPMTSPPPPPPGPSRWAVARRAAMGLPAASRARCGEYARPRRPPPPRAFREARDTVPLRGEGGGSVFERKGSQQLAGSHLNPCPIDIFGFPVGLRKEIGVGTVPQPAASLSSLAGESPLPPGRARAPHPRGGCGSALFLFSSVSPHPLMPSFPPFS